MVIGGQDHFISLRLCSHRKNAGYPVSLKTIEQMKGTHHHYKTIIMFSKYNPRHVTTLKTFVENVKLKVEIHTSLKFKRKVTNSNTRNEHQTISCHFENNFFILAVDDALLFA